MNAFLCASRRPGLKALCTVLLAMQLAACGGGDGNAGNGTTTPPQSSGQPPVTKVKLTLKGAVTDNPIANALVTATVGAETFTATADANGNYSLDIEVAEANTNQFVTLVARGAGEQSFVEFTSLAGSLQSLVTQAGDGTLLASENFATQITNVSTAEAVLLRDANGGQPITSNALLASLGASLNGQDVLDLATAIKLVVDDPANYSLPAGQTSVLALVSDAAARQQFVDDVYAQNPATFSSTQTAITADPDLSPPVSAQSVPAALTAAMLGTEQGFTFNYNNRVSAYTFKADGTGTASAGSFHREMTWVVDGSSIKVTYSSPVETVSYETENCNGTVRQVETHYRSEGVALTLLSARTLATTETSDITYADCPSLAAHQETSTSARTILTDSDFQVLDVEELRGATQSIYVYDGAQDRVVSDIAQINADGTGTTRLLNKSFTWSVDATGKLITADFSDGTTVKFRNLHDVDEVTSDLFYEVTTANGRFVDAGASVYADPQMAVTLIEDNIPGRAYQFGIGNEASPDSRLKSFRLRFNEGGTGAQEDDYLDAAGTVVTTDEITSPWNAFRWTLENNDIVVRRTFNSLNGQANCLYGTANCVIWDLRRIIMLGAIDLTDSLDRVYWIEQRQFENAGVTSNTPTTYLVRFYDYEDLPASAAVAASAGTGVQKTSNLTAADAAVQTRASRLRGPQRR